MGSSILEYLWLLAHVTAENPGDDGKSLGIVEHGNSGINEQNAADLGRSRDATLTNLERLEAGNYIERSAAVGRAYEYKVQLSRVTSGPNIRVLERPIVAGARLPSPRGK